MNLEDFGWNERWQQAFDRYKDDNMVPARITAVYSERYELITALGKRDGIITGKMRFNALYSAKKPSIGDWVAAILNPYGPYPVQAVLPRLTCLQRQEATPQGLEAQVIGSNVDSCLLVQSLSGDFNVPRMDRYLAMIWDAGATPMLVLTKADLLAEEEIQDRLAQVQGYFSGISVVAISAVTGYGIAELKAMLKPRLTYAAIGSSGVGKSTLLNLLLGEEKMRTAEVRQADQRGRHTTTHRELFRLPNGALYIDTPGMRELGLFNYDGVEAAFPDIINIAAKCKFRDCRHKNEPGCAVRAALENGELASERWRSYLKLKDEQSFLHQKQIRLNKKISKARIKRSKIHYKDYIRGVSTTVEEPRR